MMPKIIYGTAWKKERTTALVLQALKLGFRGIDTACQPKHYREELVGEAIQSAISSGLVRREDLFIQTKFTSLDGQDRSQSLPYSPHSPPSAQVSASVLTSLKNLGVSSIDSVILHGPLRTRADTLSAYRALEAHVTQGVVRQIGVSNFYDVDTLEWLWDEARVKPQWCRIGGMKGTGTIGGFGRGAGIKGWGISEFILETWRVGGKGEWLTTSFWTLTGSPKLLARREMVELAEKKRVTPEQLLYKLCQIWGITPLCGSTDPEHVREALEAGDMSLDGDSERVRELKMMILGRE